MAFSEQNKPLTSSKILGEAFKVSTKNSTLILPILLLTFLTSSLVFVYLLINPITTNLVTNSTSITSLDPKCPKHASIKASILKDLKEIVGIQAILIVISFIISSLITIGILRMFSGKLSTTRDFFCSLFRNLKQPMITKLYVKLLSLGYFFLLLSLVGIVVFIGHSSIILRASGQVLALLGLILYLYLAMVWSVSVVISVVEENCYGLEAISKAGEIVKGRRRQGVKLILMEYMVIGLIYSVYRLVEAHVSPSNMVSQMAIALVYAGVTMLTSVFGLAVNMVFYCDCKWIKDGEVGMAITDGGFRYANVSTKASDDGEIP